MSRFTIPEAVLRRQAKADGITHLSTGIAIIRDGKVLAVRRAAGDYLGGNYELPGGGIEPGETFEEAVKREAREETGLEVTQVLGMFPGFDYSTPKKPHVRQYNFLVTVASTTVQLSLEHDSYVWLADEADVSTLPTTAAMMTCFTDALEVAADLQDV